MTTSTGYPPTHRLTTAKLPMAPVGTPIGPALSPALRGTLLAAGQTATIQANALHLSGFEQFRISPEERMQAVAKKRDWPDKISKVSLTGMSLVNITLLFSPLIAKRAAKLYVRKQAVLPAGSRMLATLKTLSDAKGFQKKLFRLNSLVGLVQLNTNYQTSLNSQQPSKLLGSMTYTLGALRMLIKPSVFNNIISFVGSIFWFAGERNDIENSNHPGQRREWDFKRLLGKRLGSSEQLAELKDFTRFVATDLRYALSLQPWKELFKGFGKDDWSVPQSYQTAFASQFNGLAWLSTVGLLASDKVGALKAISPALSTIAKTSAGLSALVAFLPLGLRAWQSRGEMEGVVTLTGIPLATFSRVTMAAKNLSYLKGVGGIGAPMVNEGKRLSSRKYRAFVNHVKSLHQQAVKNPRLTAQELLTNLQTRPAELKTLEKQIGKVRVEHLRSILQDGVRRQQAENTTLAQFLYPFTLSTAG